jgi:hypothetical protein
MMRIIVLCDDSTENVKYQLTRYIENENILITQQSGFLRNHSCKTSLNVVLKQWKEEIDKNKIIVAVFLDLKRAFEAVDRSILMQKLFCYGITENEYDWINDLKKRDSLCFIGNKECGTGCAPRLSSRSACICVIYQRHCYCNTPFNKQTCQTASKK